MVSVTSWSRLEPRARSEDLERPLQARVHDPLWLLARQWQFGEFQAEDAGSPVAARLRVERAPLTRYHPGPLDPGAGVAGEAYDSRNLPLEARVERERLRGASADQKEWRLAAEAGAYFLQLLARNGLGRYQERYRAAFRLKMPAEDEGSVIDEESRGFLRVMSGRVPDGYLLYDALRNLPLTDRGALGELPPNPQIDPGDVDTVAQVAGRWRTWFEGFLSEPTAESAAWIPERMEYAFAVAAPTSEGETTLVAQEYAGGHLDWYAFDVDPAASLGVEAEGAVPTVLARLPTPVSYRGMPATRWWEFEDAEVNFSHVEAGAPDLLRLLFVEFALDYSDDWFVVPVDVEVGSVAQIHSLVVSDTFGQRTLIPHYSQTADARPDWGIFYPSRRPRPGGDDSGSTGSRLFVPPVLLSRLQSPAVEEVLFLRDEMANMAWAVERVVASAIGTRVPRFERYQEKRKSKAGSDGAAPGAEDTLRYVLSTQVPDYWIPLVPERIEAGAPDIRLRRARLLLSDSEVRGAILEPGEALSLFEEEVPRAGIRVTRSYQTTRWIDGSSHLWIGRRKGPGRGEGWSGLRFDVVES